MSCTSPLYRIDSRKPGFLRLPPDIRAKERNYGVFIKSSDIEPLVTVYGIDPDSIQKIRCGGCVDCRLAYSRDWAVRCMLESQYHEHNYFITLTYDDYHLPTGEFVDFKGDIYNSSLQRKDVVDFVKRLRKYESDHFNNDGIKVFYCGEYGDLFHRPHYHLIVFGMSELTDLELFKQSGDVKHYKSQTILDLWSKVEFRVRVPLGFISVSDVNFDTCAYTARYVMKKQKGKTVSNFLEYYDTLDENRPELIIPEFVGMSRRPGIASRYFAENADSIYKCDEVFYASEFEAFKSKPPRYFDKLYDINYPGELEGIKENRKVAALISSTAKASLFSEAPFDRLKRQSGIDIRKEERRKACM